MNKLTSKEYTPWVLFSSLVPIIMTAACSSWMTLILIVPLCWLTYLRPKSEATGFLAFAQWLSICALLAKIVAMPVEFWPGRGAQYAVPAVLLLLAGWGVIKGAETAVRSSNIFRYGVYAVFLVLAIMGVRQADIHNWGAKTADPKGMLLAVLLIPTIGNGEGKNGKIGTSILFTAILSALIVPGVLGNEDGVYKFGRSLSSFGAIERVDSILALAITLGIYSTLSFLLTAAAEVFGRGSQIKAVCISVLFTGALYALPFEITGEALSAIMLLLFTLIPGAVQMLKPTQY